MLKNQKNRFLMLEGVHAYLTEHEEIYQSETGLIEARDSLLAKMTEINETEHQRFNVLAGKVNARTASRNKMTTLGLAIASKLYSLGIKSGSSELTAQSDYSRSVLIKKRDIELLVILDTIKSNAVSQAEALSQYGITAEKISAFAEGIASYRDKVESKISAQSIKAGAGKNIEKLFTEARVILKSIDKMMEEYYESGSQFYMGYKSARSIKNYGIRHRQPELQNPNLQQAPVPPQS